MVLGAGLGVVFGCLAMMLLPTPPKGPRLFGLLAAFGGVGAGLVHASQMTVGRFVLERGDPRALAGAERDLVPGACLVAFIVCGLFFAQFARKNGASQGRTGAAGLLGATLPLLCAAAAVWLDRLAG